MFLLYFIYSYYDPCEISYILFWRAVQQWGGLLKEVNGWYSILFCTDFKTTKIMSVLTGIQVAKWLTQNILKEWEGTLEKIWSSPPSNVALSSVSQKHTQEKPTYFIIQHSFSNSVRVVFSSSLWAHWDKISNILFNSLILIFVATWNLLSLNMCTLMIMSIFWIFKCES